jgi:putative peptidoglycan lipid II flippase
MLGQVVAGNVVMIAFLWFVAGDTQRWIEMGAWSRAQWMTLLVVGGGGLYFGTLYVLGMRLHEVRVRPAGPQPPA